MHNLQDTMGHLESAMEAASIAWWWMEMPSGTVFFSHNKTRMMGREKEDFFHYSDFTKLVHPDDYEPMMKAMRDHMEGKTEEYVVKYRIKHADGHYVQFLDKGKIIARKGKEIEIAGIVLDASMISRS